MLLMVVPTDRLGKSFEDMDLQNFPTLVSLAPVGREEGYIYYNNTYPGTATQPLTRNPVAESQPSER